MKVIAILAFIAAGCFNAQPDPKKLDSVQKQIALRAAYPVDVGRFQIVSAEGEVYRLDTHNGDAWVLRRYYNADRQWEEWEQVKGSADDPLLLKRRIEDNRQHERELGLSK